jgi:pimeloyl-ACP methyl ester carboxylesterase
MLDVRGTRLAATITGDGPRTLVWGHGLISDRASEDELGLVNWQTAIPETVRLVRYDARGHGRSDAESDADALRWSELGRDMVGVADAVGAERFVAGGASMGVATAVHAAVAAPDRVEALVLMIPPTAWDTRADQAQMYAAGVEWLRADPEQAVDTMASSLDTAPAFGSVISAGYPESNAILARHIRSVDPARLAVAFEGASRSDLPERDQIAALDCPALILAWAGDPGHPIETARHLHDLLRNRVAYVAESVDDVRQWPKRMTAFLR